MPVHILLTKCDKLKSGARKKVLLETSRDLANFGDLVSLQLFSALKNTGAGELKGRLQSWLSPYIERPEEQSEELPEELPEDPLKDNS